MGGERGKKIQIEYYSYQHYVKRRPFEGFVYGQKKCHSLQQWY